MLLRTNYTDLCYGYNAFWRIMVPEFGLPDHNHTTSMHGDGFEIETYLNLRVANHAVVEVPSYEYERRHGISNLNAVRDGWRVLKTIFREYFGD